MRAISTSTPHPRDASCALAMASMSTPVSPWTSHQVQHTWSHSHRLSIYSPLFGLSGVTWVFVGISVCPGRPRPVRSTGSSLGADCRNSGSALSGLAPLELLLPSSARMPSTARLSRHSTRRCARTSGTPPECGKDTHSRAVSTAEVHFLLCRSASLV